jgi:hypothetical protein
MKILRIRRGFTTNSSASSEWIPGQTPSPISKPTNDIPMGTTRVVKPMSASDMQGGSHWTDSARLGGLVGVVALAFIAERVTRLIRKKKNKSPEVGDE